jgi:hypothetical protein
MRATTLATFSIHFVKHSKNHQINQTPRLFETAFIPHEGRGDGIEVRHVVGGRDE